MNFFISSEMFSVFISPPSCNLNSNSNIQKKKMEKYGYRKRRNEFQSHESILFCNNDENAGSAVFLFFYCSIAITLNHEQLGKSIQYDYLSANVLAVCTNFNQDLGQNLLKLHNFVVTAMEYFILYILHNTTTLLLFILNLLKLRTW